MGSLTHFGPSDILTLQTHILPALLKFVYSEKTTKFCEISTLHLSTVHTDKSKVEILQKFCGLLRIYQI